MKKQYNLLKKIVSEMKSVSIESKPFILGLLAHPDFLIVPEVGQLVSINYDFLKDDDKDWRKTLATFEAGVELKLALGLNCKTILILESHENINLQSDKIKLLRATYDDVVVFLSNSSSQRIKKVILNSVMRKMEPRQRGSFWDLERKRSVEASFLYEKNKKMIVDRDIPVFDSDRFCYDFLIDQLLSRQYVSLNQDRRIFNAKDWFVRNETRYYFEFDLVITDNRDDSLVIIELVNFRKRNFLSKLMAIVAKSRLIEYKVSESGKLNRSFSNRKLNIGLYSSDEIDKSVIHRYMDVLKNLGVDSFIVGLQDPISLKEARNV